MFSKRVATLVCGVATLAGLGATATTAAAADPMASECQGLRSGVNNFHVTTNPTTGGQVADMYGGGLLCGSDFGGGKEVGFESGTITNPTGVQVRCANPKNPSACTSEVDLDSGRYIGDVTMALEAMIAGSAIPMKNVHTKMYVDQAPPSVFGSNPNTDCTATAIACYQGLDDLGTGTSNVIVKKSTNGQLTLSINKPKPLLAGVTKIYFLQIGGTKPGDVKDMHLCRYAGAKNGSSCGTSPTDWQQKNSAVGTYGCESWWKEPNIGLPAGSTWRHGFLLGPNSPPLKGRGYEVSTVPNMEPSQPWLSKTCSPIEWLASAPAPAAPAPAPAPAAPASAPAAPGFGDQTTPTLTVKGPKNKKRIQKRRFRKISGSTKRPKNKKRIQKRRFKSSRA